MDIETLQKICHSLPDVTEDIKWETHLCFNIGGKMFLITSPDEIPVTASFKTTEEKFNELIERNGCKPAPYLAKHKWVKVDNINILKTKEWKELIEMSYNIIQSKLPKKKKN